MNTGTAKRNKNEEEIDLIQLATALWHRAWLIAIVMLIGGVIAFCVTRFLITPKYSASAMIYVNNSSVSLGNTKVSITSGDLTAQEGLIDTYSVILKSRNTLETVIEKGQLPYSYEQLRSRVTAGSVNSTGILQVSVIDEDPSLAAKITNIIVDILPERITTIVEGSSVEVVDRAVEKRTPISPNVMRNTLIGVLLGFILSAAAIILRVLTDTTIRSEDYLMENFPEIPILAVVPDLTDASSSSYYAYKEHG